MIIGNARIGLKSTVMHYKTIKFKIKVPLNIRNFHFAARYARAKSLIIRLCVNNTTFVNSELPVSLIVC